MISYVWRRTKTKNTNHIQEAHNQLWSPVWRRTKTKNTNHIQEAHDHLWSPVWRRTKTKNTNHIQEAHNQLWSPMSEGGEQKPKRLIIYKTHTINYDHLCLKEESKHKKHSSYTRHTQSTMITYVWRRRTKTRKTNHIQDTHNQLWSPMSEGGEQKKRLIIYKKHTISYDHLCLKEENKNQKS